MLTSQGKYRQRLLPFLHCRETTFSRVPAFFLSRDAECSRLSLFFVAASEPHPFFPADRASLRNIVFVPVRFLRTAARLLSLYTMLLPFFSRRRMPDCTDRALFLSCTIRPGSSAYLFSFLGEKTQLFFCLAQRPLMWLFGFPSSSLLGDCVRKLLLSWEVGALLMKVESTVGRPVPLFPGGRAFFSRWDFAFLAQPDLKAALGLFPIFFFCFFRPLAFRPSLPSLPAGALPFADR